MSESGDNGIEWWSRISMGLGGFFIFLWSVAFSGLGFTSIYVHGMVLPIFGLLSVPLAIWGIIKSTFNPPVWRKWRTIGFVAILIMGYFGTTHILPAPVYTSDFESETTYRLPFDGEWYTLAGGDSLDRNYHVATAAFRWAYDFTILKEGKRFEGKRDHVEDYFCFGKPVVAPADGEVVTVEKGNPDRDPGESSYNSILGNHLVIETAPEEYLFLAHLQQGSIKPEKGATVERGEAIAECGNSGRTLRPHLHIHLQASKSFPWAKGLPLRFSGFRSNGETVSRGIPAGESNPKTRDGTFVQHLN